MPSSITRTSFDTGDIPIASEWNTQFDTVYNRANGWADGTLDIDVLNVDVGGTTRINSSGEGLFSTLTSTSNGNINIQPNGTGNVTIAAVKNGWTSNLGITYSSNTFSVSGANAALSSSNVGYVGMPSKSTPGISVVIPVTADQGFIDDTGASEIIGNLFGASTGVAWGNDVPFYIYAVSNDNEDGVAFMCSRVPHMTTSPVVGEIGAPDDPVADNEYSFFSFDNIDETLYDENPCVCIGSFRMQMSASDDWTVQTLANSDGIGQFQEGVVFTMPLGQNGSASGSYLSDNGGTAPIFSSNFYLYEVMMDGHIYCRFGPNGDGGTDGSGAVTSEVSLPFKAQDPGGTQGSDICRLNSATGGWRLCIFSVDRGTRRALIYETDNSVVQNGDFGNGGRNIFATFLYLAATS